MYRLTSYHDSFQNISDLRLICNMIESLQMIESRLDSNNLRWWSPRIVCGNWVLAGNAVAAKIIGDPKEKEALLYIYSQHIQRDFLHWILKYRVRSRVRSRYWVFAENQPRRMEIHHRWRRRRNRRRDNGDWHQSLQQQRAVTTTNFKRIKPELWPRILERAYEKSNTVDGKKKYVTGMFYLLLNGSVLQDIITTRQGADNNVSVASTAILSEDDENDLSIDSSTRRKWYTIKLLHDVRSKELLIIIWISICKCERTRCDFKDLKDD